MCLLGGFVDGENPSLFWKVKKTNLALTLPTWRSFHQETSSEIWQN